MTRQSPWTGRVPDAGPSWGVRGVTMAFGERIALRDVTLDALPGQVTGRCRR